MQEALVKSTIDVRAIIDPTAKIAHDVKIGPWSIIGPHVEIDEGCEIASHVVIESHTKLGKHNKIFPFASIGSAPQHLEYRGEPTTLEVGDHNIIREYVTINRGTIGGRGITRVGSHNYLMTTAHIAHDCHVGNHIIFANSAAIAGFVDVKDHAILGAYAGVHQHVQIGEFSFLGRATKVCNDILPYMLVTGNPGVPNGLNLVGLKRNDFTANEIRLVKEAFMIIYKRGLKKQEILEQLGVLAKQSAKVQVLLTAFENSHRGIAR